MEVTIRFRGSTIIRKRIFYHSILLLISQSDLKPKARPNLDIQIRISSPNILKIFWQLDVSCSVLSFVPNGWKLAQFILPDTEERPTLLWVARILLSRSGWSQDSRGHFIHPKSPMFALAITLCLTSHESGPERMSCVYTQPSTVMRQPVT